MKIIKTIKNLRFAVKEFRNNGKVIALVPTMGALHDGHLTLVREAQKISDAVIVSIFVNPTQFGEGEDLDSYPRQLEEDAEKLKALNVSIIWAPEPKTVYPEGFATSMHIKGLDDNLCGEKRPGHFDGVILIVSKLFNQTDADIAFFGEKDYQQLAIIKQMTRDLDFDIQIVGVPTVRNADGLALSSRNAYLSDEERRAATALPNALKEAAEAIKDDATNIDVVLKNAHNKMLDAGFQEIDYINFVDAKSLQSLKKWDGREARLLAAAFIGSTRLIDNLSIK